MILQNETVLYLMLLLDTNYLFNSVSCILESVRSVDTLIESGRSVMKLADQSCAEMHRFKDGRIFDSITALK